MRLSIGAHRPLTELEPRTFLSSHPLEVHGLVPASTANPSLAFFLTL